jgi:hypothetical protein
MKYLNRLIFCFCFYGHISVLSTQLFECTGSVQTLTVPVGVSAMYVDIQGASGGFVNGGTPGYGARVQSYLNVTTAVVLNIFVGCEGGAYPGSGGFNGGGSAGSTGGCASGASGGGGASDIRVGGSSLANRIVVAGGGGGYYYQLGANCSYVEKGGDAGETGNSGSCNCGWSGCSSLPGGGTTSSGGIASPGAQEGALADGGNGRNCASGGGGGGYYGGGGGGDGGPGGGGSSMSSGTGTVFTTGYRIGHGLIEITFISSPTSQPTNQPSRQPSTQPSVQPSIQPSLQPTSMPTFRSHTFLFTETVQHFTIPSNVQLISVDMSGASGGLVSGVMGLGARVQAVLPVVGGSVLNIYVGGYGGAGSFCVSAGGGAAGGGWNGGGSAYGCGAGGGGATDIRLNNNALTDRIAVAGGAGGDYYDQYSCLTWGYGGNAGLFGGSGTSCGGSTGGGGASPTTFGAAGSGASSGAVGIGGNGASGVNSGGGGAGYYGGNQCFF